MRRAALALAVLVVALDQLTKWVILTSVMQPPRDIEVTSFFNLVLAYNPGISFSLLNDGAATQRWLLIGVAAIIVVALLNWLRAVTDKLMAWAIGAVIGGAIGNVVDRLMGKPAGRGGFPRLPRIRLPLASV